MEPDNYPLIAITIMQLILAITTARSTASSETIKALSTAVATLRTENTEMQKARKKREREIERDLQRYIAWTQLLVMELQNAGMTVPPMPEIVEEGEDDD